MDKVDKLIDALTLAFGGGAAGQERAGTDATERALRAVGGADLGGPGVVGGGRRTAGARHALRSALLANPGHFSSYVEEQLRESFSSRAAAGQQPTMREYLEQRSRLGAHRPTISWMWSAAGARDALRLGKTEECLARLDLLLIAGEQSAIDVGSWVLAQELLWEDDPPFSFFAGHLNRQGDSIRAACSRLCDPRWAEVAMARISEVDAWNDRKVKIQARPNTNTGSHPTPAASNDATTSWRATP